MKILHLISGGDKGGAKTHMFALLDELVKLADVTVVCLIPGVFYEEILERPVKTVLVEQKNRFDYSVVDKISKMINDEHFDIVNAHGARANHIATKLKKKIHIPIVTTIHSDYKLDFDSLYKKIVFAGLNRRALGKIDFKIAVSNAFKKMLVERGFLPNDICTVYNGMDFSGEINAMPREEFARIHNIPFDEQTRYIGIAARFDIVKGVDVFIRACAICHQIAPNTRFIIAGEGAEENNLKALAKELGIEEYCHFIGFITPIYDFLNFIDVNSLTSRSESFPYSILEGAKAHKATVAAAVGGIPDLVIDGKTGYLFDALDYTTCGQKFAQLAKNDDMRDEYGNSLFVKASTEFSNLALAKQYLSNYEKFITKFKRDKKYDVVLSGYYGFGNFGDDMMLDTIISNLKDAKPDAEICVLSKQPLSTRQAYDVDSFDRYNFSEVLDVMSRSKAYVNGGGTLLCDITSSRSIIYYEYLLRRAHKMGLSTMIMANGIGPFKREKNKKRAIKALNACDTVTLRDREAYDLVKTLVPTKENVFESADISLLSKYNDVDLPQSLCQKYDITKGQYIVCALRHSRFAQSDYIAQISEALRQFGTNNNIKLVFVPLQFEKDKTISDIISSVCPNSCVIDKSDTTQHNVCALIANAKLVFAMRLHALIVSAATATPCVALAYDKKVVNFMTENEIGPTISDQSFTAKDIIDGLDQEYFNPSNTAINVDRLRELAQINIPNLLKLL